MKRFSVCFAWLSLIILSVTLTACSAHVDENGNSAALSPKDYLRIHVRANDNTPEAQAVKYAVKEELTVYLSPLLRMASTKAEAVSILSKRLSELDEVVNRVLKERGFPYRAKSFLRKESFPTRVYDEACLPEGVYDALIVTLGAGKGDNWWCVAYPPLCFLPETSQKENFSYRSAVWDWLKSLLD